jgi:hypothetical protein
MAPFSSISLDGTVFPFSRFLPWHFYQQLTTSNPKFRRAPACDPLVQLNAAEWPGSNRINAIDCDCIGPGTAPKNRRQCSWSWRASRSWVAKAVGHVLESHKALFCKLV